MKTKWVFCLLAIISFFSLEALFADCDNSSYKNNAYKNNQQKKSPFEPGLEASEETFPQEVFYPASFKGEGAGLFLSSSITYWQIISADAAFYSYVDNISSPLFHERAHFKDEYEVGFKVSGGCYLNDDWKIFAEYTYVRNNVKKQDESTDSLKIYVDSWFLENGNILSLEGKFHLNYDAANFCLGRDYYVGRALIFSPYFGVHGDWISEHLEAKAKYNEQSIITVPGNARSKGWFFGFRSGLDAAFLFTNNFKLIGKGAFNLGYHHIFIKNIVMPIGGGTDYFKKIENELSYELELGLALALGGYVNDKKCHVEVILGYDFIALINQPRLADTATRKTYFNGDDAFPIYFHGVTGTFQFSF